MIADIDIADDPRTLLEDWLRGPMRSGSVLMHAPGSAFQSPGGGECQLLQTAKYLDAQGVAIRPFLPWTDRLTDARLLHVFGMSREGLELAKVARSLGVPIALSPICWYDLRSIRALAGSWRQRWTDTGKWALRRLAPRLGCWRRELLRLADVVLPNSRAEAEQLIGLFDAEPEKIAVVPNGVESRFSAGDPALFRERMSWDDEFVMCAGRIEPRKNTLGLIRAVRETGLPLVVIGDPVPGCEAYARRCAREGAGFTRFVGRIEHDDPMLASAYAAARVFALPSWFETPGLAALEAALAGRAVTITPYGCAREYFGDRARYARPDRREEIANAIEASWRSPENVGLAEDVGARYHWSVVARRTQDAYDRIAP